MSDENERPEAELPPAPEFLKADAAPPPTPEPVEAPEPAAEMDYGLRESLQKGTAELSASLKEFMDKVGNFLSRAIDDATSLEVKTYVTEDMSSVTYQDKELTGGVRLRALTRISIDGDTLVCVPEENGEVDTAVWGIHMEMTKQAQDSRAEFVKTVVQAVTGLASLFPK